MRSLVSRRRSRSRGRHRPPVGATILVEPGGDLRMPLAETVWRNPDPDADGEPPLGHSDHFARIARHWVPFVLRDYTAASSLSTARIAFGPNRKGVIGMP